MTFLAILPSEIIASLRAKTLEHERLDTHKKNEIEAISKVSLSKDAGISLSTSKYQIQVLRKTHLASKRIFSSSSSLSSSSSSSFSSSSSGALSSTSSSKQLMRVSFHEAVLEEGNQLYATLIALDAGLLDQVLKTIRTFEKTKLTFEEGEMTVCDRVCHHLASIAEPTTEQLKESIALTCEEIALEGFELAIDQLGKERAEKLYNDFFRTLGIWQDNSSELLRLADLNKGRR